MSYRNPPGMLALLIVGGWVAIIATLAIASIVWVTNAPCDEIKNDNVECKKL